MKTIDPALPLIDLHHHLDGSIRLETILDLGLQHNLPLPAKTLEGLRPYVQVSTPQPGVMKFIEKFEWMTGVLVDYDACRRVAYENVEDAFLEGIDYIELRYSPWFMAEAHQLNPEGVVEAVTDGIRAGERDFGIRVNQLGILSRHYGPEIAMQELDAQLRYAGEFAGLDLAGDEAHTRESSLYRISKRRVTPAGISLSTPGKPPVRSPSGRRYASWVRSASGTPCMLPKIQRLLDYLRDHSIGIECNLTSNVQTSTVADYPSHPLRLFMEKGLLATHQYR